MEITAGVNLENDSVRRILKAATLAFARSGYRGASMNTIAREACVSKSLVHYHFDSKEHLFVEVQLSMFRRIAARISNLSGVGKGAVEGFERALDEVMAYVETEIDSMRVLIEFYNVAASNPKIAERMAAFEAQLSTLMERGLYDTLGPAVDQLVIPPARVVRLLRTIFNGLVLELAYSPAGAETTALVHQTFSDCRTLLTRAVLMGMPAFAPDSTAPTTGRG
jgi:TetR/AcrR family transcriptional repressor of nem operon